MPIKGGGRNRQQAGVPVGEFPDGHIYADIAAQHADSPTPDAKCSSKGQGLWLAGHDRRLDAYPNEQADHNHISKAPLRREKKTGRQTDVGRQLEKNLLNHSLNPLGKQQLSEAQHPQYPLVPTT